MDPLEEAFNAYELSEKETAGHEANYKDLDSQTKIKLARSWGITGSQKEREIVALGSESYGDHMAALSIARELHLKWRAQRNIDYARWETARSILSATKKVLNN